MSKKEPVIPEKHVTFITKIAISTITGVRKALAEAQRLLGAAHIELANERAGMQTLIAEKEELCKQLAEMPHTHWLELKAMEKERDHWKANHDNMKEVKRAVLDRPDLGERSALVQNLIRERDTWCVEATELDRINDRLRGFVVHTDGCVFKEFLKNNAGLLPLFDSAQGCSCTCGLTDLVQKSVEISVDRVVSLRKIEGAVFPAESVRNPQLMAVVLERTRRAEKHCPLFGEHRSIPCNCGYPTPEQQVEINAVKDL